MILSSNLLFSHLQLQCVCSFFMTGTFIYWSQTQLQPQICSLTSLFISFSRSKDQIMKNSTFNLPLIRLLNIYSCHWFSVLYPGEGFHFILWQINFFKSFDKSHSQIPFGYLSRLWNLEFPSLYVKVVPAFNHSK